MKNFIDAISTQLIRLKRIKGREKREMFIRSTTSIIKEAYSDLLLDFEHFVKNNALQLKIGELELFQKYTREMAIAELAAVEDFWPFTLEKPVYLCIDHVEKSFYNWFASDVITMCESLIAEYDNNDIYR